MAYLGWQAAVEQKFGKREGVQELWVLSCSALPGVVFSLLGKDWFPGVLMGAAATCAIGPAVYDKTSQILRNNSVGVTRGSKIIKTVQASAYAAVLTTVFLLSSTNQPEGEPVNIEKQNTIVEVGKNNLILE